ncbi:alpha-1,3-arabinosyltransferase XAT3 isoform X2 [Zea mays]|uniref:Glycosyltransferase 61 catalytic domain-containing protein n=1 Tax=Zea mays TaxID=4577 RepID=A0A804QJV0_MAIZE|nr:uncharacterized protein LOC100191928 isoform X2 [Zea mays]|eukprot:XP_008654263.1 uncharacterized LOC100191928 isoform X2 [Zea mays]
MGMDAGGGKLPYSYAGQQDGGKLVKSVSRVEPRRFGLGLVAGFLLVTCAYFSTAKFDAIQIAMTSRPVSSNAGGVGVGSLEVGGVVAAADTYNASRQGLDLGKKGPGATSMADEGSEAEALEKDGGKASSPSGPGVPAALLPPVSSEEAANSTLESGVKATTQPPTASFTAISGLEDEELQVQDAVASGSKRSKDSAAAAAATRSANVSSPSVVHSHHAILPAPAQRIPEVKQADSETTPAREREWKPLCDVTSNRRIDWCELDGDVRVVGANASVTLVAPPGADNRTFRAESWRIKPYPRKADPNAMRFVRVLTVRSVASGSGEAACTDGGDDDVPALVFSDRGYTGNYFHAFTDVILPLFLTARRYAGEVRLLVADLQPWWVGKFLPVFRSISKYELVDLDRDPRVRCFRHVQVGLTSHADFSIDPRRAPNGYSMLDFTRFMRAAYGLPRGDVVAAAPARRPRLLVVARARTRRFVNTEEIVRGAEAVGFEAVVSEGTHEVAPFAELANGCDAIMGVHGAGLTNMVFLPTGGVVIQVVPLGGLEFVAGYFRGPSVDMGLRYLEYRIEPEESTLVDQYPRDHPIFTDPNGIKSKGWESLKDAYLDKQDVRLDMERFRPTLQEAIAHLRKAKAKANGDGNN